MDQETKEALSKIEKRLWSLVKQNEKQSQHLQAFVTFQAIDRAEQKAVALNAEGDRRVIDDLTKDYLAKAYKNYREEANNEHR